jgi:hypothetical protein
MTVNEHDRLKTRDPEDLRVQGPDQPSQMPGHPPNALTCR